MTLLGIALEEGVCFSFHVKSSMDGRAVTANLHDRKARNEPSDIGKDYRKLI